MGGFPDYLYGQTNNFTLTVEGPGELCISAPISATFHYYSLCPSGSCTSLDNENSCTTLVCIASVCRESTTTPCPNDNCMISQCLDGACLPPVSKCTPPSNPCQVNECVDNECVIRNATDGLACDSGDVCLTASCSAGQCITAPLVCDDGDPCTEESCFPNRGCLQTNIIAGCGAQPSPSNLPRPTPTPGSGSIPSPSPTPSTSPFGCFGTRFVSSSNKKKKKVISHKMTKTKQLPASTQPNCFSSQAQHPCPRTRWISYRCRQGSSNCQGSCCDQAHRS